jgi:hypothetical protein
MGSFTSAITFPVLVPGGIHGNWLLYGSEAGGDAFFERRFVSTKWDVATGLQKHQAMHEVTAKIENLNILGVVAVTDQLREFPRAEDTTWPVQIENAVYLEAYEILAGRDPQKEYENIRVKSYQYGNIKAAYDTGRIPEHITEGWLSAEAWNLISGFIISAQTIRTERMS